MWLRGVQAFDVTDFLGRLQEGAPVIGNRSDCSRGQEAVSAARWLRWTDSFGDAGEGRRTPWIMFIEQKARLSRGSARAVPSSANPGQLLESLLGSIGMARDQVFIANVIKCRRRNRDRAAEIEACTLSRPPEYIKPKIIVTLGRFPYSTSPQPSIAPASAVVKLSTAWRCFIRRRHCTSHSG